MLRLYTNIQKEEIRKRQNTHQDYSSEIIGDLLGWEQFIIQERAKGRNLLPEFPLGVDSVFMHHPHFPDRIKKRYFSLTIQELQKYYSLMHAFGERLQQGAPKWKILHGWKQEAWKYSPALIKTITPLTDQFESMFFNNRTLICVELPHITGTMISLGDFNAHEFDTLFALFLRETYGEEFAQAVFYSSHRSHQSQCIFSYPNAKITEDGSVFLLDVNTIKHLVRAF